jgi:excisionase family DNA binding protein
MAELSARQAADRLGVSTREVNRLIHNGSLRATKLGDKTSAWLIDAGSLNEYGRIKQGRGRSWNAATAWALLDELSGIEQTLHPVTRFRISQRISTSNPDEIARKAAARVKTRRFAADDRGATASDLTLTGESAADRINVDLVGPGRTVEGYVPDGDVEEFIRSHLLVEDPRGDVVIYDTSRSVGHELPVAVVAADLARSTNTRARAAGVRILGSLRERWIASKL